MPFQQKIAKAGKLISVERGENSSYEVIGFFVVLKDFCADDELKEFLDARPNQRENYKFKTDEFLAELLKKGLLLEIDYGVLDLGVYSDGKVVFRPFDQN